MSGHAETARLTGADAEPPVSLAFHWVAQHDPLARPLLEELAVEYSERYGFEREAQLADLVNYPAQEFAPPGGGLVVALAGSAPVSGGAFRRYDDGVAEVKRVWTDARLRGRGLGKQVLAELERAIAARGYPLVVLTTGPRQPEAVGLYLASGYTPLFDIDDRPVDAPLPFRKELAAVPAAVEARLREPFAPRQR